MSLVSVIMCASSAKDMLLPGSDGQRQESCRENQGAETLIQAGTRQMGTTCDLLGRHATV